jgi:hypothetical protein
MPTNYYLRFGPRASDRGPRCPSDKRMHKVILRAVQTPRAKHRFGRFAKPYVAKSFALPSRIPSKGFQTAFLSKVEHPIGTPTNRTVDEDNKRHAMWIEAGASSTDVSVKFPMKYNASAHGQLTIHQPLPALALHAHIPITDDMDLVVMKHVSSTSPCNPYTTTTPNSRP